MKACAFRHLPELRGKVVPATASRLCATDEVFAGWDAQALALGLLALVLLSNPGHASHAGDLGLEQAAAIIRRAQGSHGTNRDYLEQLVRQLECLGMADGYVQQLQRQVAGPLTPGPGR